MKIVYAKCHWGDIVLCEGPPGSKVFWPDGYLSSLKRKKGTPFWKTLETKKDDLAPRTRIVIASYEIWDTHKCFRQALRNAHAKLPKSYQNRGIFGVALKGEPYEAEGKPRRNVGFFYIPSAKKWDALYESPLWGDGIVEAFSKVPVEGYPAETWW